MLSSLLLFALILLFNVNNTLFLYLYISIFILYTIYIIPFFLF